jgi:multiple sugar transport system ATP-binding protein
VTTVYVTHDQIEAMTLGTKVAVLKDGQLQQTDTPQNLFDYPANLFVATFIGSPAMNLAEATLVRDQGPAVVFADYKLPVPEQAVRQRPGLDRYFDQQVIIGIRPTSFEDANFVSDDRPRIKAEVAVTEELGSEVNVIFTVHTPPVEHDVMIAMFDKAATDHVEVRDLTGAGENMWTARVNPKTSARPGHTIELAIDASSLHWFDPETGQAIGRAAESEGTRARREARSEPA